MPLSPLLHRVLEKLPGRNPCLYQHLLLISGQDPCRGRFLVHRRGGLARQRRFPAVPIRLTRLTRTRRIRRRPGEVLGPLAPAVVVQMQMAPVVLGAMKIPSSSSVVHHHLVGALDLLQRFEHIPLEVRLHQPTRVLVESVRDGLHGVSFEQVQHVGELYSRQEPGHPPENPAAAGEVQDRLFGLGLVPVLGNRTSRFLDNEVPSQG